MFADTEKKERTLAQMQELNLPRMQAADIASPKEGVEPPAWYPTKLDEYLSHFLKPQPKFECVRCETPQTGFMGAMFGGFTWGLAHGEGFCETCRWPGRAYHFVKDENGDELCRLNVVLQYHPDELSQRDKAA